MTMGAANICCSHTLSCLLQHIPDPNAVPCGGVVHHDVGHRTHQPAVLEDRTSAHALDNAAGGLQQALVRHLNEKIPAAVAVAGGIHLQNPNGIFLHRVAGNVAENGGVPGLHFVPLGGFSLMLEYQRLLGELNPRFELSYFVRPYLILGAEVMVLVGIYMIVNRKKI